MEPGDRRREAHGVPLVLVDDVDRVTGAGARDRLRAAIAEHLPAGRSALVLAAGDPARVADLLPDGVTPVLVELPPPPPAVPAPRRPEGAGARDADDPSSGGPARTAPEVTP